VEPPIHNLVALFKQLGLDNSKEAIEDFINKNKPLPGNVELHQAQFWNQSQASFLKEAIEADSDWAETVDILNVLLREPQE
jgi:hypothetical protein